MKNFIYMLIALCASEAALASGSTDYICAVRDSNLRYRYGDGEEITAKLSRAVTIDLVKAKQSVIKESALTLDAWQVDDLIISGARVLAVGCDKDWGDEEDYKKCMRQPNAVDRANLKDRWETEKDSRDNTREFNRITQSTLFKDGTRVELNIRNYSTKDSSGEYYGTLAVKSENPAFSQVGEVKVNCSVSTP